jgi:hypothetical protein
MKFSALTLIVMIVAFAAVSNAQDQWARRRPPQCTPEPVTMIGLGVAGLGLLRARMKKA